MAGICRQAQETRTTTDGRSSPWVCSPECSLINSLFFFLFPLIIFLSAPLYRVYSPCSLASLSHSQTFVSSCPSRYILPHCLCCSTLFLSLSLSVLLHLSFSYTVLLSLSLSHFLLFILSFSLSLSLSFSHNLQSVPFFFSLSLSLSLFPSLSLFFFVSPSVASTIAPCWSCSIPQACTKTLLTWQWSSLCPRLLFRSGMHKNTPFVLTSACYHPHDTEDSQAWPAWELAGGLKALQCAVSFFSVMRYISVYQLSSSILPLPSFFSIAFFLSNCPMLVLRCCSGFSFFREPFCPERRTHEQTILEKPDSRPVVSHMSIASPCAFRDKVQLKKDFLQQY